MPDRASAWSRKGDALALITETIEEPGASAINEIVHTLMDHLGDINKEYCTLFQLTHPDRERFERDGWPSENPERQ